MERNPVVAGFEGWLSGPSSRLVRRCLTGFWIVSVLGVVGTAAWMAITGGAGIPLVHEQRVPMDYAFPVVLSFVAQYVDATLGMGYGTTLTALLVMLGFPVTEVVIAVLLQQLLAGGIASLAHHALGNADLHPGSFHFRLAMLLGGLGLVGGLIAAGMAVAMPISMLDRVIGVVIVVMGLVILLARRAHLRFSWWRAGVLGVVAGANKGFMGGGYGPIVVAGQIAAGDNMRHAVAVTALAEALSCVGGIAGYIIMGARMPWALTGALVMGGIIASILAAATVRALPAGGLKSVVGVVYLVLGGLMLYAGL